MRRNCEIKFGCLDMSTNGLASFCETCEAESPRLLARWLLESLVSLPPPSLLRLRDDLGARADLWPPRLAVSLPVRLEGRGSSEMDSTACFPP